MRAWGLAVLVLAAACGAKTTCKLTAPKLETGLLTADGTQLRDEAGRVVLLRGVNMGGRSKFAPYAPFDFPDGGYQAALDAYLDRAQGWATPGQCRRRAGRKPRTRMTPKPNLKN